MGNSLFARVYPLRPVRRRQQEQVIRWGIFTRVLTLRDR